MSRPVEFAEVQRRITEFGDRAALISVTTDHTPHVVTAMIGCVGDRLVTQVGSSTAANLAARPRLSLTWPAPAGGEYMLILDGTAQSLGAPDDDGVTEISIHIERGILHRLAGLSTTGPNCVSL